MLARLRLLLLGALLAVAWPAAIAAAEVAAPTTAPAIAVGAPAAAEWSPRTRSGDAAVEAAPAPFSDAARAPEGSEVLTVVATVLVTTGVADPVPGALVAPTAGRALLWCDLVQCRRAAGAQLLRFATPPPAER